MVQEATRTAVSHKFSAPSPNLSNLKPPSTQPTRKDVQTIQKPEVSLEDLQHAQYIEELATAAHLSLKANVNVLQQLKSHYLGFIEHEKKPEIFGLTSRQIMRFIRQVTRLESEFVTEILRLDALLRVIDGRKSLVGSPYELYRSNSG
jgi:hypothetical protein